MKIAKVSVVSFLAPLFNDLNLAIGENALTLWECINEVNGVVEPFEKFRAKLIKDLDLEGKSQEEAPEAYEELVKQLNTYLEGDIEIKSNFLTEKEFKSAIKSLLKEGGNFGVYEMKVLQEILVKKEDVSKEEEDGKVS